MIFSSKKQRFNRTSLDKCKCTCGERVHFDYSEWDKHVISDPHELREKLDAMNLVGRKIIDFRFTSHVYNMTEDHIEETLWGKTRGYPDDLHEFISEIDNVDDLFPFPLWMRMDEPVLIKFEDGDQFEILVLSCGQYIISMNEIPWNAEGKVNTENINGSVLLDFCKNVVITKAEVLTETDESGEEYSSAVRLSWEKNRNTYSLFFNDECFDYMSVAVTTWWDNAVINCPFITVKKSMYK